MLDSEDVHCEACERTVEREAAIRRKTVGDLDPSTWQTLCCPRCGRRMKTVFVGDR